jgi:hypothetical protein
VNALIAFGELLILVLLCVTFGVRFWQTWKRK